MFIKVHTEVSAEDNCMLQALNSRSAGGVEDHLAALARRGSGPFMEKFYVGYGHKSIGQGGFATCYIEGVSMIVARAIEDFELFRGQECSSRYIDFSSQVSVNPYESLHRELAEELFKEYRFFYTKSLEPLREHIRSLYPIGEGEDGKKYETTVDARVYDILGGWQPGGVTTNLSWTVSLSDADDHLIRLMHHPLEEVREMAVELYSKLYDRYPHSFKKAYADIYKNHTVPILGALLEIEKAPLFGYTCSIENFYFEPEIYKTRDFGLIAPRGDVFVDIDNERLMHQVPQAFHNRPRHAPALRHIEESHWTWEVCARMDFRSFRDVGRHRDGYCSNPILEGSYGIHPWYMESLTPELQENAQELMNKIQVTYKEFVGDEEDLVMAKIKGQYILPMASLVDVRLRYRLRQMIYFAELRSGKTVHPTVRPLAQAMGAELVSQGIPCHYDADEDNWTLKRGGQDITQKLA